METVVSVLQRGRIENGVFMLPNEQLDRKLYVDVAKALNGIGATWKGGKVGGFVTSNPKFTEDLNALIGGENINLKKDFQFFETPPPVIDVMRGMAVTAFEGLRGDVYILEPSAGNGAIIRAFAKEIKTWYPEVVPHFIAVELNERMIPELQMLGAAEPSVQAIQCPADFMEWEGGKFHLILANPPFTKNQDIRHLRRMYGMLRDGGTVICITSDHWTFANDKESMEFREWINKVNSFVNPLPNGAFKDSGTGVRARIISITKD